MLTRIHVDPKTPGPTETPQHRALTHTRTQHEPRPAIPGGTHTPALTRTDAHWHTPTWISSLAHRQVGAHTDAAGTQTRLEHRRGGPRDAGSHGKVLRARTLPRPYSCLSSLPPPGSSQPPASMGGCCPGPWPSHSICPVPVQGPPRHLPGALEVKTGQYRHAPSPTHYTPDLEPPPSSLDSLASHHLWCLSPWFGQDLPQTLTQLPSCCLPSSMARKPGTESQHPGGWASAPAPAPGHR